MADEYARRRIPNARPSFWRNFPWFPIMVWLFTSSVVNLAVVVPIVIDVQTGPRFDNQSRLLLAGTLGLWGAIIGEVAYIRATLLKPGHLWPWEAKTGTKPLGVGKYMAVTATDLLFGYLAGIVVYGEHVGLSPITWKGALMLFFAGMSGPEILHRLGGTIRK